MDEARIRQASDALSDLGYGKDIAADIKRFVIDLDELAFWHEEVERNSKRLEPIVQAVERWRAGEITEQDLYEAISRYQRGG